MTKVSVAIVGKQQIMREGIIKVLSHSQKFEILADVARGEELAELCKKRKPDVILMCCSLPDCDGVRSIQNIHEKLPTSYIVVAGDDGINDELITGIKMGVRAYLSSNISVYNLISVLTLVALGKLVLSPHVTEKVVSALHSLPTNSSRLHVEEITVLTHRERVVLDLVKNGLTNKEIATALGISEHTVKVHVLNTMQKLNAHTRQQAVNIFSKTHQTLH